MWVVRDFTLQLKSASGRDIPPKTYLEKALKPEQTINCLSIRMILVLITIFEEGI